MKLKRAEKDKVIAQTWNYIGETVQDNARILGYAALSAMDTSVRVAPFRDEYLMKLGVWIAGKDEEVIEVKERLEEKLKALKIKFNAMKWQEVRERG